MRLQFNSRHRLMTMDKLLTRRLQGLAIKVIRVTGHRHLHQTDLGTHKRLANLRVNFATRVTFIHHLHSQVSGTRTMQANNSTMLAASTRVEVGVSGPTDNVAGEHANQTSIGTQHVVTILTELARRTVFRVEGFTLQLTAGGHRTQSTFQRLIRFPADVRANNATSTWQLIVRRTMARPVSVRHFHRRTPYNTTSNYRRTSTNRGLTAEPNRNYSLDGKASTKLGFKLIH